MMDSLGLRVWLRTIVLTMFVAISVKAADEPSSDDKWRAWAVTSGSKTKLVVEGIYSEGGPGLIVLVADRVPQGINPRILLLDVKTVTLPGAWPAVLQPVPAHYIKTPYKQGQYDSVELNYPDGTRVEVKQIVNTGAGPG